MFLDKKKILRTYLLGSQRLFSVSITNALILINELFFISNIVQCSPIKTIHKTCSSSIVSPYSFQFSLKPTRISLNIYSSKRSLNFVYIFEFFVVISCVLWIDLFDIIIHFVMHTVYNAYQ